RIFIVFVQVKRGQGNQFRRHYIVRVVSFTVVKDSMVQGGDFSEGNGEENFSYQRLTEGRIQICSRFSTTMKPIPHLDGHHVGDFWSRSYERERKIRKQMQLANHSLRYRPSVKRKRKKKHRKNSQKHKKEKNREKGKKSTSSEREAEILKHNPKKGAPKADEKEREKRKTETETERGGYNPPNCQPASYQWQLLVTRSGRKIKGRGPRRYRTPPRSRSRNGFRHSETPSHWRQEMQRVQRMRVLSGERWIKGDKSELNEIKENQSSPVRVKEKYITDPRHVSESPNKKSEKKKKVKDHKCNSKEGDIRRNSEKDDKYNKNKVKKRAKSKSSSKSKEKSESRERDTKHNRHGEKRMRPKSKERDQEDVKEQEVLL
ncbi:hypothetical protein HPG69_001097, partial [Diceros bicornis minor]